VGEGEKGRMGEREKGRMGEGEWEKRRRGEGKSARCSGVKKEKRYPETALKGRNIYNRGHSAAEPTVIEVHPGIKP
jgi:hypothetical protein